MYTTQQRLDILRQYETYCYQICHFILQDDEKAAQATKDSLICLYQDDSFFSSEDKNNHIIKIAKRISIKNAAEHTSEKQLTLI